MVKAIEEMCSVCGHSRFYHEKGVHDCVIGGLNDSAGGHSFAGSQRALWSDFIPHEIPVPILYIPVEGDVLDSGGFTSNGTWTGTEAYEDDFSGANKGAATFDGANRFNPANEAKYDFEGIDKFSWSCWFKGTTFGDFIFGKRNATSEASVGWSMITAGGTGTFLVEISDGTNESIVLTSKAIADNNWHYLFVTYSGNQNESGIKAYVDGILEKQGDDDIMDLSIKNDVTVSAGAASGGAGVVTGAGSEFTIWDNEMTAAQIAFLYNSGSGRRVGFNLRNGLLLKADFNGNLTDDATTPNTLTVDVGVEQYTTGLAGDNGIPVDAFDFNGTTRVNSNNEATFDFVETTKFTLSCWFKTTTLAEMRLIFKNNSDATASNGWGMYLRVIADLACHIMDGTNVIRHVDTTVLNDGEWHHAVMQYDGVAQEKGLSSTLDGTETTNASTTTVLSTMVNNFDVTIGSDDAAGDGLSPFTGQIQQACIWNRKLSKAEVTFLFNSGKPLPF